MTPNYWLTNPYVFYGIFVLLGSYLLYVFVRKRQGARPGQKDHDPEL